MFWLIQSQGVMGPNSGNNCTTAQCSTDRDSVGNGVPNHSGLIDKLEAAENQGSESKEDPQGVPSRGQKQGHEKKPKVSQDFPDPDPVRKRQENGWHPTSSSRLKPKHQESVGRRKRWTTMTMTTWPRRNASRLIEPESVTKTVVDSDHDGETEIVPARPQPKPKAQPKMKSKGKVALAPVHIDAEDAGFTDEEDDHSDPAMGAADEEDKPDKDADNLQGLAADEVERRLAHSVPQWSSNHDEEDFPMLSRPSSHASFSSGHYSVPKSNFDGKPIEVSSDSDSDSDTGLRGALSGMRAARDCLPAPTKIITTSRHESQKPAKYNITYLLLYTHRYNAP
ncbi:hypothetical protein B0H17DRAFT_1147193 [Mycena rosella]|uniref:Uncharacterized protein n=1 Tax=Mycena rosella TaxID=1033263 RepID=A0AAD7CMA5_MYCRO|nr:hypothetical protein B0H17DRAFT_1147193 [Mycena rosella]